MGDSEKHGYGKPYPYGHSGNVDQGTSQPLTIALAVAGNLTAVVDQGRTGLTLTNGDGQAELRYTGLAADVHLRSFEITSGGSGC